jgi:hypothetical protein
MYIKGETKNCYNGRLWSDKCCPDGATCGKNWVIDGADYQGAFVFYASGDGLILTFVTHGQYWTKVGIGLHLYQLRDKIYELKDKEAYELFKRDRQGVHVYSRRFEPTMRPERGAVLSANGRGPWHFPVPGQQCRREIRDRLL